MSSFDEIKKQIRKSVKASLRSVPADERSRLSCQIMEKLSHHPRFVEANTVLLFHSLPDEPDTHEFIRRWDGRKRILLPVVTSSEDMVVRLYEGEGSLTEGSFHISEPAGSDFTDFSSIDLAVIPGVAFDAEGHRLGRGRGYYDRFLSAPSLHDVYKIGVCFPCQFLASVPAENHDIRMNEVIV